MSEEIEKMAEKEYPKPPFLGHYGNIARSSRIEGFIKGHQKATEWISVEDRLPEGKTQVLGYLESGVICTLWSFDGVFYWEESCRIWNEYDAKADEQTTHWQPLPPAPKQK